MDGQFALSVPVLEVLLEAGMLGVLLLFLLIVRNYMASVQTLDEATRRDVMRTLADNHESTRAMLDKVFAVLCAEMANHRRDLIGAAGTCRAGPSAEESEPPDEQNSE